MANATKGRGATAEGDGGREFFVMETIVELDDRRRPSLGKIGRHSRYLVREEDDGTLIWQPAVVMTEFEAALLSNPEVMGQIKASLADPNRLQPRNRRQKKPTSD